METAVIKIRGKTLCKADVLATLPSQARGLMFAKKARPLLFVFPSYKRRCIHSFFCPVFDAVFLDGKKKVVAIYPKVQRGRSSICADSAYLLECLPGTALKFKIKLGDWLTWQLKKS